MFYCFQYITVVRFVARDGTFIGENRYGFAGEDWYGLLYCLQLMECYPPDMVNEVVLLDEKHNEAAWEPIFKDFVHTFLNR